MCVSDQHIDILAVKNRVGGVDGDEELNAEQISLEENEAVGPEEFEGDAADGVRTDAQTEKGEST